MGKFLINNYGEYEIVEYLIDELGTTINVLAKNPFEELSAEDREYLYNSYNWAFEFVDILEELSLESMDTNVNAPMKILCKYEECKERIIDILEDGKAGGHLNICIKIIALRLDLMEAVQAYKQSGF